MGMEMLLMMLGIARFKICLFTLENYVLKVVRIFFDFIC